MIRWGIIGCGKIASKFAKDLHKIPDCELYGVASRTLQKAEAFAKTNQAKNAYASYEQLAHDDNIDVVYIATPHPYHKDNTILCLDNKKHVLCEKPFAMNTHEVREMIASAKKNKRFLMEAIWTQFFPYMRKLQEILKDGIIGEIKMIEADFGFKADFDPKSRLFDPELGGGALLDIGIYPLFLCHTLLGKPDQYSSTAIKGITGVDESTAINLAWNSGAIASLNCTVLTDTKSVAKIYGKNAYIEIQSRWHESKTMTMSNREGVIENFDFKDEYTGYAYEIMEVNKCIKENSSESALLPLNFSLSLMESLDLIRSQINLKYPADLIH